MNKTDFFFTSNDKFKIVERIPHNYCVWNIGRNMGSDNYVPFCQSAHNPENKFEIDPNTLIAIRLPKDDVQTLRIAARRGLESMEKAEKYIKNHPTGSKILLAKKSLAIYKTIYC